MQKWQIDSIYSAGDTDIPIDHNNLLAVTSIKRKRNVETALKHLIPLPTPHSTFIIPLLSHTYWFCGEDEFSYK